MQYLAFAMRLAIMIIGLYTIYINWAPFTGACLPGVAIFLTGLYLAIQGKHGDSFTGCIFSKETPKKKWFFSK